MITEHVNRIPVHLDGKTIYDIVLEDFFDLPLAKEISALALRRKRSASSRIPTWLTCILMK